MQISHDMKSIARQISHDLLEVKKITKVKTFQIKKSKLKAERVKNGLKISKFIGNSEI
jgi:hypothetical protein